MPAYQPIPSEFPPEDADFGTDPGAGTAELLDLTWSFFTQASPATRNELRRHLTAHGWHRTAGLGAFLDGLQFSAERHRRGDTPGTT